MPTEAPKTNTLLAQILKNESPASRLREGDVVEVVFLRKMAREAFFDMGKYGTGIVFGMEF